jgi:hypothetical protein
LDVSLGLEYFDMERDEKSEWLVNLCAFHLHAGVPKGTASPGLLHHHNQEQKQKCNASHAIKTHVIQIIQRHAHTQQQANIQVKTKSLKPQQRNIQTDYNIFFPQHNVIHGPHTNSFNYTTVKLLQTKIRNIM